MVVKVRIRAGAIFPAPQPFIGVAAETYATVRCTTIEVMWTWTDMRSSSCTSGIVHASACLFNPGQTSYPSKRGAVALQNEAVWAALLSRVALPALFPHRQGCLPDTAAHLLQSLPPHQHAPFPRQHRKGALQSQRRPAFPFLSASGRLEEIGHHYSTILCICHQQVCHIVLACKPQQPCVPAALDVIAVIQYVYSLSRGVCHLALACKPQQQHFLEYDACIATTRSLSSGTGLQASTTTLLALQYGTCICHHRESVI